MSPQKRVLSSSSSSSSLEPIDKRIKLMVENYDKAKWERISQDLNLPPDECKNRYQSVSEKKSAKKVSWTEEEDRCLKDLVNRYGPRQWSEIAKRFPRRNGKQCRERWLSCLDPKIKNSPWTKEEDEKIIQAVRQMGTRWSEIAKRLPGRPSNAIKNHWHASLKSKYSGPPPPKGNTFWNEGNPWLSRETPLPPKSNKKYVISEDEIPSFQQHFSKMLPQEQISTNSLDSSPISSPSSSSSCSENEGSFADDSLFHDIIDQSVEGLAESVFPGIPMNEQPFSYLEDFSNLSPSVMDLQLEQLFGNDQSFETFTF